MTWMTKVTLMTQVTRVARVTKMTLMKRMKLCVGERNNIHRCVTHHAILYFPLAILIDYSANPKYVEEHSLARYTQNS